MSSEPLTEDEFKNRDAMGLQKPKEEPVTEEAETSKYIKMLFGIVPLIGLTLATILYLVFAKLLGQEASYQKKIDFIQEYQLGYIFLSVWLLGLARSACVCQANGARAAARVDRPDQHVYKIMDSSGPLTDAPYVLMATSGPQGRFNRAQRGVFNTDESMPVVLANVILTGAVYGPLVPCVCLLICYGRVTFTRKYKQASSARAAGFIPSMIGEQIIIGLTLLTVLKSFFHIPF